MIPQYILKLNGMVSHSFTLTFAKEQQLLARIARTESNSGVRQNRQVLPGRAKAPNEMSSQRELKIFNKSMCTYLNENLFHFSKLHILTEGNFSF